MATRVSAYAEDSSTELTDERRLPLIVRSPKNLQKDTTARRTRRRQARGTGRGAEGGGEGAWGGEEDKRERNRDSTRRKGVLRNKLRRNSLPACTGHRPCTPPIHLRRAYIFGRLVFPPREIYHVPTPLLSRAAPSVPDVWQGIIGRAEEWPLQKLLFEDDSWEQTQSYGENDYFRNYIYSHGITNL